MTERSWAAQVRKQRTYPDPFDSALLQLERHGILGCTEVERPKSPVLISIDIGTDKVPG
jgi:hypothetical protein